jgi:hypothetical protein
MPATAGWYQQAVAECLIGTIDLNTDTLKLMLVTPGYVYDPDHTVIDNGANNATDPSYNEIVATNYTGGFGGGGRKTATITGNLVDTATNKAFLTIADLTWSSLGGASNATVGALILVKEITNDTASRLIAYLGITNRATDGSDFPINFASAGELGNLQIAMS